MGYNKGDDYEQNIFDVLNSRRLIVLNSARGGAGNAADIRFIHNLQEQNLEVKLNLDADYGQKMLKWKDGIWSWRVDDAVTSLYTSRGILEIIKNKNIIPNRYSIPKELITTQHKKQDQRTFADKVEIDTDIFYDYYAIKNCYYIQIGGYGFYHLKQDILSLGTPQLDCKMNLRLRAKTIHSKTVHSYEFYAVLKVDKRQKIKKSYYDIESGNGRIFPPIA